MHRIIRVVVAASLVASGESFMAAAEPTLPLEKVVLFTSGVGSFQHAGEVTDDASVEMTFKAEEVNDLLKSMVVEDAGGAASTVSYASRDPITKTLDTFAVKLTDNPSMSDLLGRLRGEKIEVDAATPVTGTIVGVEARVVPVGDDKTVSRQFVTILAADGLRTLPLDSITRLRLLDARLQGELEKALAVLALGHDNEKKSVTLAFTGKGPRKVRVGYVQESPLWKTSYRLMLDAGAAGPEAKAALQGWAIVENTTDHDWKDVRMSLVSGRPISFAMDLYRPLYVPRPVVRPELYASLLPQVYGQNMADEQSEFFAAANGMAERGSELAKGRMVQDRKAGAAAPAPPGRRAEEQGASDRDAVLRAKEAEMLGLSTNLQSLAAGVSLGELFRYEIATPVTIARQRSAMLPIVADRITAERVAIYDERVLAKHPLSGVRLKNTTALNLMQGPVTVYDEGGYCGDARIEDMAPGSERLLSYAVDLDVEVVPRTEPRPDEIVSVRLVKGTLIASRRLARLRKLEVKNSGDKPVKLLIEHPIEQGWKLVGPQKADETTRDRYRFAVAAEPGKPATLEISEEMPVEQSYGIATLDDNAILLYSRARGTSPAVKESLAEVIRRKQEIERIAREKTEREQEINAIGQEQARIRENMGRLERTSDLYTRYVQKFSQQETRVETLREEIAQRQTQEQQARQAFDTYLLQVDVK
ncbi:MAG: hypothetical protein NTY17_15455 [Planctomycetia bacterium]|nr:hypothetical protein [Planctomycetia bacterium]